MHNVLLSHNHIRFIHTSRESKVARLKVIALVISFYVCKMCTFNRLLVFFVCVPYFGIFKAATVIRLVWFNERVQKRYLFSFVLLTAMTIKYTHTFRHVAKR